MMKVLLPAAAEFLRTVAALLVAGKSAFSTNCILNWKLIFNE